MLSFKLRIHYRLHKNYLNKTSNISHNYNKFCPYNRHQTAQRLCFPIGIIGTNIIELTDILFHKQPV